MKSSLLFLFVFISILSACKNAGNEKSQPDFLAKNIDTTVNPANDFFDYAVGDWAKNTTIPPEESGWGIGNMVQEEIYNRLRKINEDAAAKNSTTGVEQKIGDFWYSGMDTLSIEKQGLAPLKADLDKINQIRSVNEIVNVASDFHNKGINVLFNDYVSQDDKNSDVYAYQMTQGGLGMPNRDYYFKTDSRTEGVRKAYRTYLTKTFIQLGNDSGASIKIADDVYNLEKRLANSSRKLADLRDPYKNYNKMNVKGLTNLSSAVNWRAYFKNINANKIDSLIVGQPEFYQTLNDELTMTPLDEWKNYLRFHLVSSSAPYLDKKTFSNFFDFRRSLPVQLFPGQDGKES